MTKQPQPTWERPDLASVPLFTAFGDGTDPALVPYIPQDRAVHYAMGVAGALLVLAIGKLVQSRRRGPPAAGAA